MEMKQQTTFMNYLHVFSLRNSWLKRWIAPDPRRAHKQCPFLACHCPRNCQIQTRKTIPRLLLLQGKRYQTRKTIPRLLLLQENATILNRFRRRSLMYYYYYLKSADLGSPTILNCGIYTCLLHACTYCLDLFTSQTNDELTPTFLVPPASDRQQKEPQRGVQEQLHLQVTGNKRNLKKVSRSLEMQCALTSWLRDNHIKTNITRQNLLCVPGAW